MFSTKMRVSKIYQLENAHPIMPFFLSRVIKTLFFWTLHVSFTHQKSAPSSLSPFEHQIERLFRLFAKIERKQYKSLSEFNFRKRIFARNILGFVRKEDSIWERVYSQTDDSGRARLFISPDRRLSVDFSEEDDDDPMKFELNWFSDMSQDEFRSIYLLDQAYFDENRFAPHFDSRLLDSKFGKKNVDDYVQRMKELGYRLDSLIESKLNLNSDDADDDISNSKTFFNPDNNQDLISQWDRITPHFSTDEAHESIWSADDSNDPHTTSAENFHSDFLAFSGRKLQMKIPLITSRTVSIDGVEVPSQINWRRLRALTPIKDQIKCNACYAFAALAAVEANHRIQTGQYVNLSEQEIVDCSLENEGCVGGLPQLVYHYIRKNNISYTRNYPYDQSREQICRKNSKQFNGKRIKSYTNLGKGILNLIKTLSIGPVAVVSYASFPFKHYGGGVYRGQGCRGKDDPNHASLLVGYNLVGRKKFLYFKNGWGRRWGESGFYKVQIHSLRPRSKGHCLVAATKFNSIPLLESI